MAGHLAIQHDLRNLLRWIGVAHGRLLRVRVDFHESLQGGYRRSQSALLLSEFGTARGAGDREVFVGPCDFNHSFFSYDDHLHAAALLSSLSVGEQSLLL